MPNHLFFCPRCDRMCNSWKKLKKHVQEQHPDHDPRWFETGDKED